jgi:hypothetical protein
VPLEARGVFFDKIVKGDECAGFVEFAAVNIE